MSQSQLVRSVGESALEAYERALKQLDSMSREAVVLRVEMGYAHDRVAEAIGADSGEAASHLVSRAVLRMAELMEAS
jgi:DNA-directed RNA polymerase specialized sigma24 family protein